MGKNVLGILLILMGASIGFFWAYPLWIEITDIKVERSTVQSTLERVKALARRRDDILAKYNSIAAEDKAKLEEFFPRSPESGLLLLNMDRLTSEAGMLLKKIAMEDSIEGQTPKVMPKGAEKSGVEDFPLRLSASGSYASLLSFLNGLEKSRRLIEVDALSFDSGKPATKDFYEFTISAHTFWRK